MPLLQVEWRAAADTRDQQIAAANTVCNAGGVTKPQGESTQVVRGRHHKKNLQQMWDRACHTMVQRMGMVVGDPGDTMMQRKLEQPE